MDLSNSLIWAARGKHWGYTFLLTAGFEDALPVYTQAFAGTGNERDFARRVGDKIALRLQDPEGRTDHAGRVISHDFVVLPPASIAISDLNDARKTVWATVADQFAEIWNVPKSDARSV